MVNNCRTFVNDSSHPVSKHRLAPHLIGATMHVLADTWAHQDFIGLKRKLINGLEDGAMSFKFLTSAEQNAAIRWLSGNGWSATDTSFSTPASAFREGDFGVADRTPGVGGRDQITFLGHGRVSHWPDHSGILWRYFPKWAGGDPIVKNNPEAYVDAFLHLIEAMRCIRTNEQYYPFELTPANVRKVLGATGAVECPALTVDGLKEICLLFWMDRGAGRIAKWNEFTWHAGLPDVDWDEGIASHGENWRKLQKELGIGVAPAWKCGKSEWLGKAKELIALSKKAKLPGVPANAFVALDYVKFNYAAKLHYRSIKTALATAFKQDLFGDWHDGAAFVEDMTAAGAMETWRRDVLTKLDGVIKNAASRQDQDDVALVLQMAHGASSFEQFKTDLGLGAVASTGDTTEGRGLFSTLVSNSLREILTLPTTLPGASDPAATETTFDVRVLPTTAEWMQMSYVRFSSRTGKLSKIDSSLEAYNREPSTGTATTLISACQVWLHSSREENRRVAVEYLLASANRAREAMLPPTKVTSATKPSSVRFGA
jgi:hypothetical protein